MSDYQRVILVTGSNTGIGFEIVRILAEKGHIVYLSSRNETAGLEAQSKLKAAGLSTVKFVPLDVTSPASISAAKDIIEKAEGRLDSLVNNASLLDPGQGVLNSLAPFQTTIATNFFSVISVSQAFVPLLRLAKPRYASIVTVSSELGSNSFSASPAGIHQAIVAYGSSKAAANSYTIALSKELAGEVKVNAVTPGLTATKLTGFMHGGKTPTVGAEVIVPWALLGPDDKDKTGLFWGPDGAFNW